MAVTVQFADADATGVTVVSDTELTATSPAGTGVVDVTVTTAGGSDTLTEGYTYEVAFPVTLTSADPTEVPVSAGGSFVVTFTGTGLSDVGGSVLPAGMPYRLAYITPTSNTFDLSVVTQVSDTEMSTQPGALGVVGDYYWVVRDATTQVEVSNRLAFTVVEP
jgi:hypothetical protein